MPSGVATTFMLLPFAKSVYCPPGTDAICPFPSKIVAALTAYDQWMNSSGNRTRFAGFVDAFLFQF